MAMNRVQFQQGLSMAEFQGRYGSEDPCEQAVIESRWPQGFVCPACSGVCSRTFRRKGLQYWECLGCSHQCSLISGTIFEATKLDLTRWFLAMHLLTQAKSGVSALELKRHLGVCYKTALLLKHKLMEVMRLREEPRQLTGRVEMDEAYLGGERLGGKPGRGSENKVPFIAAVQTTESGTTIKGMYHSFDLAKYAHRYLGAVQYLFNRRFNLRTILQGLLVAGVTTPPRPGRVLRQGLVRAEVCR